MGLPALPPYMDGFGNSVPNPNFRQDHWVNQQMLIRVVAEDVGALFPRSSLSETLKLAESPEAAALRYKSNEWEVGLCEV